MPNFYNKKHLFLESRLVFQSSPDHLPPAPAISPDDAKRSAEIARQAIAAARHVPAAAQAKTEVVTSGQGPLPGTAPEAIKPPDIPNKPSGIKFEHKDGKINPNTGLFEQPFQFGDFNLPGKIILPSHPEAGKPTTYLFNYVADPAKFDQGKFLKELEKRKAQLGNTVIITLKTPEGETQIDKHKVNTMEKLVADLEKFHADLAKNDLTKDIKLPPATKILHMTNNDNLVKVSTLLSKYSNAVANKDPRILATPKILRNEPENFVESLDQALTPPSAPAAPATPEPAAPQSTPSGSAPRAAGGGGSRSSGGGSNPSGNPSGSAASSSPAAAAPTETPSATASPTTTPAEPSAVPTTPESKEATSENLNKLLVLGDSLMTGAQPHLKANSIEKKAVESKTLLSILNEVKAMDASKALENFRNESLVMNGGINDIAAGRSAEQILGDLKEIWKIAKKYDIKVFVCTIIPFKGAKGANSSLEKGFLEKEAIRNSVNDQIIALTGTSEGPYKIIPLHKKISEGGLADDTDPSALYSGNPPVNDKQDKPIPGIASGDKLHLNPEGYTRMAKAIQDEIGQPKA